MVTYRRLCLLLLAVVLEAGCGQGTQPVIPLATASSSATSTPSGSGNPLQTKTPGQSAAPSVEIQPTPVETLAPTAGPAKVETTNIVLTMSAVFGNTEYTVVAEVTNTGGGWADITTSNQSFTLSAANGDLLEQQDFLYVFPTEIGPGQKGYYVGSGNLDGRPKKYADATLDVAVDYEALDAPSDELPEFTTSNVKASIQEFTNAIRVTGKVRNVSEVEADDAMVGVLLFGAGGKLIGALVDNVNVGTLRPGQTKGFDTAYPSLTAKLSAIKKAVPIPFNFSFF